MCYSADPRQKQLPMFADIDYAEARKIYERQARGEKVKVLRTFTDIFADPQNDAARDIARTIDGAKNRLRSDYQAALQEQELRLAKAITQLAKKPTKTAEKEQRIATDKIRTFTRKIEDLDRTEIRPSEQRFWSKEYVGVLIKREGEYVLSPMRFLCRREGAPASDDEKYSGGFNARRDNLDRFWKHQFGRTHCIVIVNSFYEAVDKHKAERRELAEGEPVKSVEIHFTPRDKSLMYIAGIWSPWSGPGESSFNSFAMVTDEPPGEVFAAGHDRCPINLTPEAADAWLTPETRSKEELMQILSQRSRPFYEYEIVGERYQKASALEGVMP